MKMRMLAYYRAPSTNVKDFLEDLESEISSCDIKTFILGDININTKDSANNLRADHTSLEYIELLQSYGYEVTNNEQTRCASGRIIDHLACNFHKSVHVSNSTIEFDPSFSDHNMIVTTLRGRFQPKKDKKTFNRVKVMFNKLNENFPNLDENVLCSNDPNLICEHLTSAIKTAKAKSSQTKMITLKHTERVNQWTSDKAIDLILEKDKLLQKRRKKPTEERSRQLKIIEDKLKIVNQRDYRNYVLNQVNTRDSRKLWRNLDSLTGRQKIDSNKIEVEENGKLHNDPTDVANAFNNYFTTCVENLRNENVAVEQVDEVLGTLQLDETPNSIFLDPPTATEVQGIIASMKNNSAPGHDGIDVKTFKTLAPSIVPLIVCLISAVFSTGKFPDELKKAIVTPIFKTGSRSSLDNYRPISVLPVLSRIIERALHRRILVYVNDKLNLLYNYQFGFRPKSGTENAAIEMTTCIMRAIDQGKIVSAIFMDLKKAFDVVDHPTLLTVLEQYGIRGKASELVSSYLENRTQIVKVDNKYSKPSAINSGVVQGSCLGPLLFLIFINGIGKVKTHGKLFLFADDAALISIHENAEEIQSTLKLDMKPIINFFDNRKMILNGKKTKFMILTSSYKNIQFPDELQISENHVISQVSTFKYLGLTIDNHMRWTDHIKGVEKKLASGNGILWKLRNILPTKIKKLIYSTLLQSHLNFMLPIWGVASAKALHNAQVLQNRALRNIYELPRLTNRVEMFTHHVESNLPIRGSCVLNTASYVYNVLHGYTHSNIKFTESNHNVNLRERGTLRPAASKTNYGIKSIETFGPKLFNKIPLDIKKSRHQHAFKWTMKCHLRKEKFISTCFTKEFYDLNI